MNESMENYNEFVNNNTVNLTYLFCYFLDPPNSSVSDCAPNSFEHCIECPVNATFLFGGTVKDPSLGHIVCIFTWMLIIVFGLLGTVSNLLIVIVLKKQESTKSFEILLMALAGFDLICSALAVLSSTGFIAFLENWNRGSGTLYWINITYFTTVLGRSGSTFMKVLITAERYIFIAHPESSGRWLSKTKTKLSAFGVLLLSVMLTVPRYMVHSVTALEDPYDQIPRLEILNSEPVKYVFQDEKKQWLTSWKEASVQFDSWIPFPLLIFFSTMIYLEIKKITMEKRALQVTRKKDIREVQMFVPVIIIMFIINILPVVQYNAMKYTRTIYREPVLGILLCVAVSSAANLPIYVCRGCAFRKEARGLLYKITNRIG